MEIWGFEDTNWYTYKNRHKKKYKNQSDRQQASYLLVVYLLSNINFKPDYDYTKNISFSSADWFMKHQGTEKPDINPLRVDSKFL